MRCLAFLFLLGPSANAAPTDPVMVLAEGERSARWIGVTGEFPAEGLVQAPIGVQVLVRDLTSGTRFVRFELGVGAFEGNDALLADGLDPLEAVVIASAGSSVSAPVLFIGPARLELLLPSGFPAGQVEVQLFAIDATGAVLSNPLTVTGGAS
ncbi:MAG: hypothetical protein JRG95_15665 [Deltaproteobacteria bacterium]|nr:hypothetical protein [Deltaproteobacteria bacterium]